jgi:hypothetical protein
MKEENLVIKRKARWQEKEMDCNRKHQHVEQELGFVIVE